MISPETLVCVAGGQEWKEFKTILSQKGKVLPGRHRVEEVRKKLYDPAWASSSKEPQEANFAQKPLTEITVEDMFRGIGIIALIAGVVLALFTFQSSPALAVSHERNFKLRRLAERCHVSAPQLIEMLVDKAIFNVELEAEDYEQIANELRHEHSNKGIGNA